MKNNLYNWFLKPTKKQLLVLIGIWLFAVLCIIFASTDGFTQPLFQRKYYLIYFMTLLSVGTIIQLISKYLKNKSR